MRNEELDSELLDPTLSAFADSLKRTNLEARCPDRDRLMYLCGVAVATPKLYSGRGISRWLSKTWQFTAVASLAFVVGGLAGRLPVGDVSIKTPTVGFSVANNEITTSDQSTPVTSDPPQGFDPQRMALIRSGENLFAAMDPSLIPSLPTRNQSESSLSETESLRAGMVNGWFDARTAD